MATAKFSGTVFVVDDDPSARKGLARLMKSAGYAVETFGSAREFLERNTQPTTAACAVLDLNLPGLNGLDLQKALRATAPPLPIIFLTGHGDVNSSVRAMKGGAVDFFTKPVNDQELLLAIGQAVERHRKDSVQHAERQELQQRFELLTTREREVMSLVVRGWMNKQVAAELGTVEKTIKVHRARLIEKMGVQSLADLVRMAEKLGLFAPDLKDPVQSPPFKLPNQPLPGTRPG